MISFLISVHLLFTGGLLTAFEVLPLLLNCIISQQIELVNRKDIPAGMSFYVFAALAAHFFGCAFS